MAKRITNAELQEKLEHTTEALAVLNQRMEDDGDFKDMIGNVMLERQNLIDRFIDPRRDIDAECGYPKPEEMDADMFLKMYEREGLAARVVEVEPLESWKGQPQIVEDEDPETETAFEVAWKGLDKSLGGEFNWYKDDEARSSNIWEALRRADIVSGIGHYGVILLGFDDGKELSEPVEPSEGMTLLYITVLDEKLAAIGSWETDESSPRFMHPTSYDVTLNTETVGKPSAVSGTTKTHKVHWSRIIHVADGIRTDKHFGTPRMRPVLNRLYDARKVYGASGEGYWRAAFPGLSIETHPSLGGDVKVDADQTRDQIQRYTNTLQRFLILSGMSAKSLAPQVTDPNNQLEAIIDLICITKGIPKRIFVGSERGELASSQDEDAWTDRMEDRRLTQINPNIIVPFVNRLIMLKVLPEPVDGYSIDWESLDSTSDMEQAELARSLTESIVKYVQGDGKQLFVELDFITKILGISDKEAQGIVERAEELLEEREAEEAEQQAVDQERDDSRFDAEMQFREKELGAKTNGS